MRVRRTDEFVNELFVFGIGKMIKPRLAKAAIVFAALGMQVVPVDGGDLFGHQQRTRTKQCLPAYNYGQGVWPFTTPSSFQVTEIAVAARNPILAAENRKPFHFRTLALHLDQLTLEQVGLSLHRTERGFPSAQIFANGKITHNGGDGGLIGNNVTIRIRAYASPTAAKVSTSAARVLTSARIASNTATTEPAAAAISPEMVVAELQIATPNEVEQIPPDAYVVWSSKNDIWVSRGGPHAISLVPLETTLSSRENLYDYFDEITHLEVELEYHRDR